LEIGIRFIPHEMKGPKLKGPKSIERVRDASETPSLVSPGRGIPTPEKEVRRRATDGGWVSR
jgi:hypothetical protein